LRQEPLTVADLMLCCSIDHPLAGRKDLKVGELLDWPWALPPEDSNNRTVFETAFRNLGLVGPAPVVEVASDPNALIHLAIHAGYLTCVPQVALDAHLARDRLNAIEIPGFELPPIQIGFVTLEQNEALGTVRALREAVMEAANASHSGADAPGPPAPSGFPAPAIGA
ncbi:MAG: substrate-binding domain-containing protein, partial [Pseudomonadota bacterium]|nr:substrate-binding domain-containing protein [Pseudomonadota bacterium]